MRIKPKKQMPANKGETGGGVRVVGTGGGQSSGMRISPNVKVVPGTISKNVTAGNRTTRGGVTGGKMLKGAEQARAENVRALAAKSSPKAIKAANKPKPKKKSK
jgi:hypothetical protein